jgi:hypothetical protein
MCPLLRIVSCRRSDCPTSRKRNDTYGHLLGLCRPAANMVFVAPLRDRLPLGTYFNRRPRAAHRWPWRVLQPYLVQVNFRAAAAILICLPVVAFLPGIPAAVYPGHAVSARSRSNPTCPQGRGSTRWPKFLERKASHYTPPRTGRAARDVLRIHERLCGRERSRLKMCPGWLVWAIGSRWR